MKKQRLCRDQRRVYLIRANDETSVEVRHEALVDGLAIETGVARVNVAEEGERDE